MDAIQSLTTSLAPTQPATSATKELSSTFGDLLKTMVQQTDVQQQQADQAIQQLHAGGEQSLHDAMIAMEKADTSLRYMVQVRNKAIEAYQEVMRMQV